MLQAHLEALGFSVRHHPFDFPHTTLWAIPILGAGLALVAMLEGLLLLSPSVPPWSPLLVSVLGTASVALLAWAFGTGARPPGADLRRDANLIAMRKGGPVRCWLVAHLDTKAQGHSMAGRLIAVWCLVFAFGLMACVALLRIRADPKPIEPRLVIAVVVVAAIAATLAGRGRLKGTSPGARDNGTGLLAMLSAVEATHDSAIGVIVTGGEEFGLIGSRHIARTEPGLLAGTWVINLDTIADRGPLYLVTHRGSGKSLARVLADLSAPLGIAVVQRRLPVGILTDGAALAPVAGAVVDVSRLDWSVLRLMHTPEDTTQDFDPSLAESLGRALGAGLPALCR